MSKKKVRLGNTDDKTGKKKSKLAKDFHVRDSSPPSRSLLFVPCFAQARASTRTSTRQPWGSRADAGGLGDLDFVRRDLFRFVVVSFDCL